MMYVLKIVDVAQDERRFNAESSNFLSQLVEAPAACARDGVVDTAVLVYPVIFILSQRNKGLLKKRMRLESRQAEFRPHRIMITPFQRTKDSQQGIPLN